MNYNNKENTFNTDPLLKEVNIVLCKGLNEICKDFLLEHQLYKNTHFGVLNLINNNNNNCFSNLEFKEENSLSNQRQELEFNFDKKLETFVHLTNSLIIDLKQVVENNTKEIN
jgi:hypothetical protein